PPDRARHVGGDGDLRPHRGDGPWREDRTRHAAGGARRSQGDRRLSRHRRGRGRGRDGERVVTSAPAPLLAIRGLRAAYGKIEALKGVDGEINCSGSGALIGANGAGKSTLMMTIFGKPRARAGRI